MQSTRVIAISGGSGSGKSLFTKTLIDDLKTQGADLQVMCEDHYYRDQSHLTMEERAKTNYDHPNAFDHDLMLAHLQALKRGESILYPTYCHKTHTRVAEVTELKSAQIIIVEGIMLLASPELIPLFDVKVFIDTPLDICLLRRIQRDMVERDRTLESIATQYEETVKPMYHKFIEPSRFKADVIVTQGGKNRIALDVMKSHIQQVLQ